MYRAWGAVVLRFRLPELVAESAKSKSLRTLGISFLMIGK